MIPRPLWVVPKSARPVDQQSGPVPMVFRPKFGRVLDAVSVRGLFRQFVA